MKETRDKYDCIVIGGGPAGLMAGIAASECGAKTLLIDKGEKLGRKLAISGGGRCNVTNRSSIDDLIKHIPGNGRFLYGAFAQFSNEDIIGFFKKLGIELKEEDHGRMFPVNNEAQSVVDALITRFRKLSGNIIINSPVKKVRYQGECATGIELRDGRVIDAKRIVIAVGGKSVPATGSTGDGYAWARAAGHTITDLFPTEVPLVSDDIVIRKRLLQGLSLQNVAVSVLNPKGKPIVTHRMDMIFTHFGLSGPAILRCSQFVVKAMKKYQLNSCTISIDALPDIQLEPLFQEILAKAKSGAKRTAKNEFKHFLPERYLVYLLAQAKIEVDEPCANVPNEKWRNFAEGIKHFHIAVSGTLPIEKAFVTGGGVSVKEVNPKTMASKFVSNLYFCGEILDIHGYTGGYNITAALVTGRIAGMNAGNED